jgi:catechol 2,3-dioxygenase-like lactoylglutathione lyase family enzyme
MRSRYHHLHLICADLGATEAFFTALGASPVERRKFGAADGAVLDLGGIHIYLRTRRDGDAITGDSTNPRFGYDHLGLQVDDLDAAYAALSAKGYAFFVPPQQQGQMRIAFVRGPDNITVELVQAL